MKSRLSDYLDFQTIDADYLPTDFSLYAQNQVNNILTRGIDDQAIFRKKVEAITIDGAESLDLDDAIWAEKTKNGYCVWIHISDVSEIIPVYSPLDLEALKRTTSIYRKNNIINMIPQEISNGIASLDEYGEKKVFTLQIDLNEQCELLNYSFYDSDFKNLKRYDYESFGEDFQNKDSEFHSTLHLLKEISNKLFINRLKIGGTIGYQDEDRRGFIGEKTKKEHYGYSEKISHDIIESFMVLANCTTGRYFAENEIEAIYKQHLGLDERSFYIPEKGMHLGLGISNYTHFTSPIRRYVDMINHRIIKSIQRGNELPYNKSDLLFIAEHCNHTRLKIDVLGSQLDFEYKGEHLLKKIRNRLGKDPEVYDLKDFIRENVSRGKKMPNCMKDAIKHKIDTTSIGTWGWIIGVVLFGKDKDLKKYLREKLLLNNFLKPGKILHLIAQTQILRGGETIFEIIEVENNKLYSLEVLLHGNKITSYSMNTGKFGDISNIKGKVRLEIINRIFDYFE